MIGADAIVKCLEEEGVKYVFGYPGVAICPFYNSILDSGIQTILIRTEQNAAHAASGLARVTGKVGVCAVTSGPGATNLITGVATAFADSIPLVCITGQVDSSLLGSDVFQEADITGAVESFVKYSYLVKKVSDIPRIMKEAFYIANTGRKGPVLIDIPIDVQNAELKKFAYPESVSMRTYKPTVKGNMVQIKKVIHELEDCKRPIICAGGGVLLADAKEELQEFAMKHDIPVVSTMMGIGVMPTEHPLYYGMVGNNGKPCANRAMNEADLIIMVGARVADRAISQPDLITENKVLIHIDVDPAEIGKIIAVYLPVVGDAKQALEMLLAEPVVKNNTEKWIEKVTKDKERVRSYDKKERMVQPQAVIERIGELTKGDAVVVTDVGQHQMWTAQYYPYQNERQLVTSGGLGTMGFGVPAAIGAKIANPDKEVILFVGDGGFQMTNQELAILNVYKVPIKVVMLNNHSLGMVRQWQESFYEGRTSESVFDTLPDFQLMAQAYGIKNYKFDNPETLEKDLEVITEDVPMFIEVDISRKEHVLPMVPAGKSNHEMLGVKFNA